MHSIRIDPTVWNTTKARQLSRLLAWETPYVVGFLTMFWYVTRNAKVANVPREVLFAYFPKTGRDNYDVLYALLEAGYIKKAAGAMGYAIHGNADFLKKNAWRSAAGSKGGKKSKRGKAAAAEEVAQVAPVVAPASKPALVLASEPASKRRGRPKKAAPPTIASSQRSWDAYTEAYVARWETEPIRNARTNGMMTQFIARVGHAEAPAVLAFYVQHNDSFYIRRTHDLSCALKDAESLVTQYRRGQALTSADVRLMESCSGISSQLARLEKGGL